MTMTTGEVRYPVTALAMRYTSARQRRGTLSAASAAAIDRDLRRFAEVAPADIRRVTKRHVEAFVDRGDLAASTRRRLLSELRGFFRWAIIEGHAKRDPTLAVAMPDLPPDAPGSLTRDVADRIHVSHIGLDPRARLMVSLELHEALRRVEVARAQIGDVDRRGRSMRVRGKARGGRGNVTGTVPLSDETIRALDTYLASEPTTLGIYRLASGPLFRDRRRPHLGITPQTVGRIVAQALYELGVKSGPFDGVSGHALRHTAATEALEAGVPLPKVQRVLRHKLSRTTDHYTRGASFDLRDFHTMRRAVRDVPTEEGNHHD